MYSDRDTFNELNVINDQESKLLKCDWGRWRDYGAMFLKFTSRRNSCREKLSGKLSRALENTMEQPEAETGAFCFLIKKRSEKTIRAEGSRYPE